MKALITPFFSRIYQYKLIKLKMSLHIYMCYIIFNIPGERETERERQREREDIYIYLYTKVDVKDIYQDDLVLTPDELTLY